MNKKYLDNKIGLIEAMIAGHCIGITFAAKRYGTEYSYEAGAKVRAMLQKEIREIYRHAFSLGKRSKL